MDYVKKHSEGNPAFSLEKWQEKPDFVALPTIGEQLTQERLNEIKEEDLLELARNVLARADEVSRQVEKRGFYGYRDMRDKIERLRG